MSEEIPRAFAIKTAFPHTHGFYPVRQVIRQLSQKGGHITVAPLYLFHFPAFLIFCRFHRFGFSLALDSPAAAFRLRFFAAFMS